MNSSAGSPSQDRATAIVTGAAQGIGRVTALALAAQGARVTILDINGDGAHAVADEVRAAGGEAHTVVGDVAKEPDVARMVEETLSRFGRLDVLVNNAVVYDREIEGQDLNVVSTPNEVWDRTMAVNLQGAVLGCRHAIPAMVAGGGGSIVNVGSTAGFSGDTNHVAYAASMAAKYSLTRSIATSHGKLGIRCNAIATGLVLSPTARGNLDPVKLGVYRDNLLVPDFAEPEDIASIIVFLGSQAGRYITGQTIIADGGFQAHQPWHAQAHIVHPNAVL
ncbi:SDR family NAD(P)-dependent oxidoreductase [Streptomyces sp. NPDC101225]|uniref:SDR family NAD(P)-dependent oxidoreductase n=1 Tax=Streptomyces sp. NPDC101225 TaxID=3366135 RepID=UPI00382FE52C